MDTATLFRRGALLIALSLPASAICAEVPPAAQKPNPPAKAGAPGAPAQEEPKKSPFDEMDTNHDGFVSRDEFLAYQKKRFDEFDTNRDGKVDAKEIASSPPLMERNLKTAERMIHAWDKNGDGVVTADEYKQDAEDRFARQDKTGSGKISRPARPQMPQMPPKGQLMPNGQAPQPPVQPQPQPQPKKP